MKYYVVINGSPHKNGTIGRILRTVAENLEKGDCTIRRFDVSDLCIAPCTGCMKCRSSGVCILTRDSAHEIAEEIGKCDGLILGTPVYWGNISGQMKLLFDRMVPVLMDESPSGIPLPLHRGKKAILVTACTTIWPFNILAGETTHALGALKEIMHYSGFKIAGTIVFPGTKNRTEIPLRIFKKAEKLVRRM